MESSTKDSRVHVHVRTWKQNVERKTPWTFELSLFPETFPGTGHVWVTLVSTIYKIPSSIILQVLSPLLKFFRTFRKQETNDVCVPKSSRYLQMSLPPLFLALKHILKLQHTNACEPKYLPRFLDVFYAPVFLLTSFTLSSKLRDKGCMWESSFLESEQNWRMVSPWSLSFLWSKHARFVKSILMHDLQLKITSWTLYEPARNFQKSGFEDLMCSAFRLWAKSQVPTTYASSLPRNSLFKSNLALRKGLQDRWWFRE